MKRRNFLHWALSLPLVGSVVGKVSGRSRPTDFPVFYATGNLEEHLVAQKERPRLQEYADEVAEVFNDMFVTGTSKSFRSWVAARRQEDLYSENEKRRKYVDYLYGDKPTAEYSMDLPHKSRLVLAINNLVNAVKQDMEEYGSERIIFFAPFLPLPADYGVVQAISESYSTCIGVSIGFLDGLRVSLSVKYAIDVS